MREIKFRAWNGKKMFKLDPLSGKGSLFDLAPEKDWYVMQYTGLKDKNGKDIYEGDIITYGFKTKDFNDLVLHTGKIFFDEYMFLVDGDTINEEWHSINRIHYVEIIGNIHESKHLLDNADKKV